MRHAVNRKNLVAGLIFIAVGVFFVVAAQDHAIGTTRRMGPGYFPTALGVLQIFLGVVIGSRALIESRGSETVAWNLKTLAIICGALVVFGFLIRPLGLVPAVFLLTIMSAWASRKFRWTSAILLAVCLSSFSHVTFFVALGLPLPPFGRWIGW